MAHNVYVPKFVSWDYDDDDDCGDDISYAQFFNTALVEKSGRATVNQNDPCENPCAFPSCESPVSVPCSTRSNSAPESQKFDQHKAREFEIHRRQAKGVHLRHEASARKLIDQINQDGKAGAKLSKSCSTNGPVRHHRHHESPGNDRREEKNPGVDAAKDRSRRADPRHRICFNSPSHPEVGLNEDSRSIRRHRHQEKLGYDPPPMELGRGGKPSPTFWEKKVSLDDDLMFSPRKPRTGHPHSTSQSKLGIWKEMDPSSPSAATFDSGYMHIFSKIREERGNGREQAQRDPISTCIAGYGRD